MEANNWKVLDGDGHVVETDREIAEYLEEPYLSSAVLRGFPFFPTLDGYNRGAILARLGRHKESYRIDAQIWLQFLEAAEIQTTVLYPTAGLAHGLIQDPDWAVALARAYNNWFHDRYYKVSPRLRGMALVPLQDVGEAVKELRRAVTELNFVGGVLPANGGDLGVRKPLGHRDFWPVYEEAERLNCALATHGAPSQGIGIDFLTGMAATSQALEHPFAQMIQMATMVMEGVFERFPRLRMAYLEAGTGWVPYMMDRLDRYFELFATDSHREFGELVKQRPSEYIAGGNIYISCEGDEVGLRNAIDRMGDRVFIFASDFPHEIDLSRAKHEIEELLEREDISDESKKNIFRDNIERFYQR